LLIDWPVGTPEERSIAHDRLPGYFFDANPFLNWYEISPHNWNWHTGADLNANRPFWNADYHAPLYAIADGTVVFAGKGGGTWGQIIVVEHMDGVQPIYSRVGHIEKPLVQTGDIIKLGQRIAQVGSGDGLYSGGREHLHFDICITDLLKRTANHWPDYRKGVAAARAEILANYTPPIPYIAERKLANLPPDPKPQKETLYVLPAGGLRLRTEPKTNGKILRLLPQHMALVILERREQGNYVWCKVVVSDVAILGWVAEATIDKRTVYLTNKAPKLTPRG
jgi:hypothetical protein